MKILLYSSVFYPSIGGIETISDTLAKNITNLGHECIVVTETTLGKAIEQKRNYQVIRQPNWREKITITKQCSLVHANGASVAMYPFARLAKKPFIWTHNGYQVSCVDGLGWSDGEATPMTPIASLKYYFRRKDWSYFLRELLKLSLRRYVANQVDLNIACTQWVADQQPLKNQVVAYTPYPLNQFKNLPRSESLNYDFIYVGRLVSEKGIDNLIRAFKQLTYLPDYQNKTLAIVGDGHLKSELEQLVTELELDKRIFFLGTQKGKDLIKTISQAKIAVVPSIWQEPMGGVALELLAAQKNLIVSLYGGHAECVGEAALKFPNGDINALCQCMVKLLAEPELAQQQHQVAQERIELFDEIKLTQEYIKLYAMFAN